ncbi:hypothetical protein ACGFWI_14040 [Streptomyces sp. NPDC048434]|uniref:hypothetical protein n=1 Tax=Streptomyces sp. NPDC048434 TaxID=3365549 RepID=UPI00371A17E6
MSDRIDHGSDPRQHPELLAWLNERAATFERWSQSTGIVEDLDFSDASLETLEDLVRSRYETHEQVSEARTGEFIQGAVWYIGELLRQRFGMVWGYEPCRPVEGTSPALFTEPGEWVTETPFVVAPAKLPDHDGEAWYPMGSLLSLYVGEDDYGHPVEEHLLDMIGTIEDEIDDEYND